MCVVLVTQMRLYCCDSSYKYPQHTCIFRGAQWLSGRVLDSRPKGRRFEPHQRQCVVVLEQDTFILDSQLEGQVLFHSGQMRNFYLLVLCKVKTK